MPLSRRRMLLVLGLMCAVVASGCTGKAKALRIAVGQFEVESVAAVNAIDTMRRKEVAPDGQMDSAVANVFADNALQSTRDATATRVKFWLNTEARAPNPEVEQAWLTFLADLRLQYTTFARIFDQMEQGSFTARSTVQQATPSIEKLTAQLAYFAKRIMQNPPQMLIRQEALLKDLDKLRKSDAPEGDKRRRIVEWLDRGFLWLPRRRNSLG